MFKSNVIILCLLLMAGTAQSQENKWINKPSGQWPPVAMINEVWYSNGERYVHPSFEYVATGFLIDIGTDTLAATVKHALWVAKMKSMSTVDLRGLRRWIMHPKGNLKDSVVIDDLMNNDTTEILAGAKSTITQRDWLVFTTKFRSPAIQPLKPRYSTLETGELIYFTGCPYSEKECLTKEARIISSEGNRIVFTIPENFNVGGFSGSPLIDRNGFLVGILGGTSFDAASGNAALYGISTRYLQDVLTHKQPLNVPLTPVSEVIKPIMDQKGIRAGMTELKKLLGNKENYLKYDFSMENINGMGDALKEAGRLEGAIEIYKVSSRKYLSAGTYLKLADCYFLSGEVKLARKIYQQILDRWPDHKEATEGLRRIR